MANNTRGGKHRGFVFTSDALLAGFLAMSFLLILSNSFNNAEVEFSPVATLRQNAEDALAAMDKLGMLKAAFSQADAQTNNTAAAFMQTVLPIQNAANLTIETYVFETGASCASACRIDGNSPINGFCTCSRISLSTAASCASSQCLQKAVATRMFYAYTNNGDSLGRATLEVWNK